MQNEEKLSIMMEVMCLNVVNFHLCLNVLKSILKIIFSMSRRAEVESFQSKNVSDPSLHLKGSKASSACLFSDQGFLSFFIPYYLIDWKSIFA